MKVQTSLKKTLILAIAMAAALTFQSVFAGQISAPFILTLTENSDASLTLSYNGNGGASAFSVPNNTSADNWRITLLSPTISLNNFVYDFLEPEDPTGSTANEVSHSTDLNDTIFVQSDLFVGFPGSPGLNLAALLYPIGTDNGNTIYLVFNDLAAANEATTGVPETGSTFGLLALSFGALLGVNRFRSPRLA